MQIREAIQYYKDKLSAVYDANESRSVTELVMMHIFNFSKSKLLADDQLMLNDDQINLLDNYFKRLITGEPVQYVLGETEFYGLKFLVNKSVLIPRPETEELVDWIINEIRNSKSEIRNLKMLDIGTGSGCIPIAIKKNIPELNAFALDVSADALTVAGQNAELNNAEINFIEGDILQQEISGKINLGFDIIVSNPPYIRKSEINKMHKNVVGFEPHLALFVDDEDALIFYKHIANYAKQHLATSGKLFFEINEAKGNELKEMLLQKGFKNIILKKDFFGKERMISCEL
jgi:release factor glutamine methyltransferase